MIKLIASDMDGTLLDGKGELPKNFFNVLNRLSEMGVMFVVASGRQYFTLADNLKNGIENTTFVAENGAFIVHKGKELFYKGMDRQVVIEVLEDCRKISNCEIILCGKRSAYIENGVNEEFEREVNKYYHKSMVVDSFNEVEDDIFKIALCDFDGPQNNSNNVIYPKWGQKLQVTISGDRWLDIGRTDINKGVAIKFLQNKFGITEEETMVFGDYYNDMHMLKSAYHSYIMENAPDGMKQYGRFIAESNDKAGVIKVIEEKVLSGQA